MGNQGVFYFYIMESFILDVLCDLKTREVNISNLKFILPSRRSGVFLKHQIGKIIQKPIFSPVIISIEEFVEDLSEMKSTSSAELLFEFYSVYLAITDAKRAESFESFSKWAQVLIQDFNEIDRYLVPQEKLFNYLSAIKGIDHWSMDNDQTELIKNYLKFWKQLPEYYNKFTDKLKFKKIGYQGLIYREAAKNIESYLQTCNTHHVFLGFNALNKAEELIIQELLQNELASIYWDIDKHFLDNLYHDAGFFIRNHKNNWRCFEKKDFKWVNSNYVNSKNIEVIGIPKNIGQAKHIGSLLEKRENDLNNTAVVLGDESLLDAVINSLPRNVESLNITMGFPLKKSSLAALFDQLFSIHKKRSNPESIYYKDAISILSNPFIKRLFNIENRDDASKIIEKIQNRNLIYVPIIRLKEISKSQAKLIDLLLGYWENSPIKALDSCRQLIYHIKDSLSDDKKSHQLTLEYLHRFNEVFNQLKLLLDKYRFVKDIKSLLSIYKELLNGETLDFRGEPLEGLQLMGMLETRVLDFETVIISSVNEGILPSGKSNNSFIPFDVKLEYNLPTYKEKDAVYAYHFFRLIQRAKNIYILYNTEPDALNGGEKSRFITQLEVEGIHKIKHSIVVPETPIINQSLKMISKTDDVMERIKEIAAKGFSPSSLTSYTRNPIDFYYQKILGIGQFEDVEETVAANTLGTVVHNTLEDFYKPFEGNFLKVSDLESLKSKIKTTVEHHFRGIYKEGDLKRGKNLLIYEIAKRYVLNFINLEVEALKNGNAIKIIAVESEDNKVKLNLPELDFPVYLTGKIDRVDEFNGIMRIIDYKTGKVEQSKVSITNWEDINTDYEKYSKPYQILAYAYMINSKTPFTEPVEAGIISFKNLNNGFLKFAKKDSEYSRTKDELITQETLDNYFKQLKELILEICNPNINFIEKEL